MLLLLQRRFRLRVLPQVPVREPEQVPVLPRVRVLRVQVQELLRVPQQAPLRLFLLQLLHMLFR